jgi:hypothetical protein
MTVLIIKDNQPFFKELHPRIKFTESTKNTCTFNCSVKTFEKIRTAIREKGLNPFATMSW